MSSSSRNELLTEHVIVIRFRHQVGHFSLAKMGWVNFMLAHMGRVTSKSAKWVIWRLALTEYTYAESFEKIAQILGHKITYERISLEAFHEQWMTAGQPFVGQHLVEVARDHAAGLFSGTDAVIEQITGQPPMDLETYIRTHREAFA